MKNSNEEGIRINKYISDYGFCSRREAEKLIDDERVTINNRLAAQGDRVMEGDKVRIDGETLVYVPQEARPKKHRWGPPRHTEESEEAPKHRAGQRGAVRNAKPRVKPAEKSAGKPASKPTGKRPATGSSKSAKPTAPKRKPRN